MSANDVRSKAMGWKLSNTGQVHAGQAVGGMPNFSRDQFIDALVSTIENLERRIAKLEQDAKRGPKFT